MYRDLKFMQRFELNSSSGMKTMLLCLLYVVSMNKTVNYLKYTETLNLYNVSSLTRR